MACNILNKEEFNLELEEAGDQLVIVDFYANWCGPCKIVEPQLHDLSLKYAGKVKFLKIDIDECEDIAMEYNITSMPTFLFIKYHQIVDIVVGGNVEKLLKNIEKYANVGQAAVNTVNNSGEANNFALDSDLNEDVDDTQDPTAMLEVIVDDQI